MYKKFLGWLFILLALGTVARAYPDLTGINTTPLYHTYTALAPTPKGDGYVVLKNGEALHLRYALPAKRLYSYKLDFHNIMADSGNGHNYHLELHKDSPNGPLLYDGQITSAPFWNSANLARLEIADHLNDRDLSKGYLDIYAIGHCSDDNWAVWKDQKGTEHELKCVALEDTPALRKALRSTELLHKKKIHLLPTPQKFQVCVQDFKITRNTRIALSDNATVEDLFTARLLQQDIQSLTGRKIPVVRFKKILSETDIILIKRKGNDTRDQFYSLQTNGRFLAKANSSVGLFYAIQTARQLLIKSGNITRFQGMMITDRPILQNRMIQYDLARQNTVNVEYCKRVIRELARFKINQLMFYMEDDYRYQHYPFTGRPNTFTPENARILVDYAKKYHVQLVPQLESLGHGSALLSHPEFADMRENGNPWNFDTSNPRTWEVLGNMIGELCTTFSNTPYIHLGCDEFEDGFGQCEACKKEISKIGWDGLYAEHLKKLSQIAEKNSRQMIFWTSHGGTREDDWGLLTLNYANKLPKNIIPMDWYYDGPDQYPTLPQYLEAGFKNIYVAPGVMANSIAYPDYENSLRSVRTYYQAAEKQKALGGCACTWELNYGNQLENCWYGFIYSAQCGWNPTASDESSFDRAFADQWLGLKGDSDGEKLHKLFRFIGDSSSWPVQWTGPSAALNIYWTDFPKIQKEAGPCWIDAVRDAPNLIRQSDMALAELESLRKKSTRNTLTLLATEDSIRIMRATARKVYQMDKAAGSYKDALAAVKVKDPSAIRKFDNCIASLQSLQKDYPSLLKVAIQNRDERGGCPGDVDGIVRLIGSLQNEISVLQTARNELQKNPNYQLPSLSELGFE